MEANITTMSQNGQVVIPSDIRKKAKLSRHEKFIVFNYKGNIVLKKLDNSFFAKDMELIEKILKTEEQIKKGQVTKANSEMSDKEIDKLLKSC